MDKRCPNCERLLPSSDFRGAKGRVGSQPYCKACRNGPIREGISKTCSNCGIEKPLTDFFANKSACDGRMSACKVCKVARTYAWRERNADKWREYVKEESRRPHRAAQRSAYQASERGRALALDRSRNPKSIATKKAYLAANPARAQIWNARKNAKRRALIKSAVGSFTPKQWEEIKARHNYRCIYCGHKRKLTVDHRLPLVRGGAHGAENIVPACKSCNSSKNRRDDIEFARSIGRLVF